MKKIRILAILIIISFLLVSCTNVDDNTKSVAQDDLKIEPLQIETNAEIAFFDNESIFYFTDEITSKESDVVCKTLAEYNFKDKKTKKITSFEDISTHSGSITRSDNTLYMPLSTNDENILFKIDVNKNSSKEIKKWNTFPPLSYVYYLRGNLILFGPDVIDQLTTHYYINKISLTDNKEVNIVKKKIKNNNGELISCVDVDESYIYAFSIKASDDSQKYSIIKYGLNGEEIDRYDFDLKAFLHPFETLANQDDAIINVYKEKDYFILNTINGKVFIFKLNMNQLQPIEIPENFYKMNPSGFRFLDYNGSSDFAYFINTFENNNVITVFNYITEEFTSLELANDNMYSYFRNAQGNLIVRKTNNQNSIEFYYYRIDSPTLNQKLDQ